MRLYLLNKSTPQQPAEICYMYDIFYLTYITPFNMFKQYPTIPTINQLHTLAEC